MDSASHARAYIDAGWSLCAIRPRSKQAYGQEWQERPRSAGHWEAQPEDGMGLIHGLSGTCSIDLDDLEAAHIALAAVGVDLAALLEAPDAVRIIGGHGRGKLLYRTSEDLARVSLNWPNPEADKRFAVLELRGGAVQDVLPPSVHPNTGQPYRWEGDWRALPELPPEILEIWRDWPAAKRRMAAACPWDDTPATTQRYDNVPRRRYEEGDSVISAWNDAHSLRPVLESFGYRRMGPRHISPHSESGLPGVVILPGSDGRLCYVHHASDPLSDGHAHDSFSVWCQLEHGGDVTRAVRAAAEILGMSHDQRDNAEGAEIAARLLAPKVPPPPDRPDPRKAPQTKSAPTDPIPIPELDALEHWIRRRHHGSKRIATTQAALAFAAAMTARRYVTSDRQPTNVMMGVVDTSTAGLRPLKGALYEAADASGERRIIRGTKVSSDAAIHRALLRSPRMLWVVDDYGYMVAMSRRQPSGAIESALAALQDTYNGYTLYLDPEVVGGKDVPLSECAVHAPGVAALALVSEDQMREVTRRAEYGRGAVQQILFARADQSPADDAGAAPGAPVPKGVIEQVGALRKTEQNSLGGLLAKASHPPSPATVELGPGVTEVYAEAWAHLCQPFQADELSKWRGIAHGAMGTVRRLSAALGAWADPEVPVVTADVARWVAGWIIYHVERSAEWYEVISTDDGDPDLVSDIRAILYSEGRRGVTARRIAERCRRFRELKSPQRIELLEQMEEDGLLMALPDARTVRYVDRAYLKAAPESANV